MFLIRRISSAVLRHLGVDEAAFDKEIERMRQYRDKFLAHLDSEGIMNIPDLETPKKVAWFYYAYLVANETIEGDFIGFDAELDGLHVRMEREAEAAYRRVQ